MEHLQKLEEIYTQIEELKANFERLGNNCTKEGVKLKDLGIPPDLDFIKELSKSRETFNSLTLKLKEVASELSLTGLNGKLDSLQKLKELWHKLADKAGSQGDEEDREKIRGILEKAKRITLLGDGQAAELDVLKEKIKHYENTLSFEAGGEETDLMRSQLQKETHPLNSLLKLIEEGMDYREATEYFKAAASEFGTLLALAAAKGSLVFQDEEGLEEAKQEEAKQEHLEELREMEGEFQDAEELQPAATATEITAIPETEPIQEDFSESRQKMLCKLIRDEKLGPAFWLASYYELRWGKAAVPSWLVKTLEIAALIRGEGGPAEEWLSYLYRRYDSNFEALFEGSPEERAAFSLLMFSALLRPALLAPESGAVSLLERFKDLPGGLKGLLSTAQGCRPQGKQSFKRQIDSLSREVKSWFKQNRKLTLASPEASKLWEMMQEKNGLLYKILNPVQENQTKNLDELRKLTAELQDKESLKRKIRALYGDVPVLQKNLEIFHIPGSWQIINRMKGALKLAERWIKFYEHDTEKAGNGSPEGELRESLHFARKELEHLSYQFEGDPLVEAGLAAAARTLDSLERLFREELTNPLSPEDVASLEISSNPQLLLKPPWEPKKETIENMGKALLGLLDDAPYDDGQIQQRQIEGQKEAANSLVDQDELPRMPHNIDHLCNNEILTPQEREFIRNTLRSLNN